MSQAPHTDRYVLLNSVLMDRQSLVIEEVAETNALTQGYLCLFDDYVNPVSDTDERRRHPWSVSDRRTEITDSGHDLRPVERTYGWFVSEAQIRESDLNLEEYLRLRNVNHTQTGARDL